MIIRDGATVSTALALSSLNKYPPFSSFLFPIISLPRSFDRNHITTQSHNFVHYNEPRFETPRFKLYFSTTMRPHKRCYIPLPLRQIYEEKKRKLTLCKIDYESYENKIARTRKLKTYSAFYKSKNAWFIRNLECKRHDALINKKESYSTAKWHSFTKQETASYSRGSGSNINRDSN